ncbi:VC0807 family protein [Pseudonocardia spinosispora]|uniref:VC0807 family protein n=1 Tax=Pseudonocardia spinosispora TaxID=103441 RepID=UPI0004270959|nr:VC0807 family protein [Pseudonocardia spinosispora]
MNTTDNTAADPVQVDRSAHVRAMMWPLIWDVGLAIGVYYGLKLVGATDYLALLAASVVSAGRLVWVAIRDRRIDPFALFLFLVFALGLALTFFTGDIRLALAKDSATSGLAGLVFLISCVIRRPLAYYASLRFAGPKGEAGVRAQWDEPEVRRRWYLASTVWGVGLLLEASTRVWVIYHLPLDLAVALSNGVMVVVFTLLITWTIRSAKRAVAG